MSGMYEKIVGKPEIVTLILKNPYIRIKRRLFCIFCGAFLQVTYKQVDKILEGTPAEPTTIEAEITCPKCKALFETC